MEFVPLGVAGVVGAGFGLAARHTGKIGPVSAVQAYSAAATGLGLFMQAKRMGPRDVAPALTTAGATFLASDVAWALLNGKSVLTGAYRADADYIRVMRSVVPGATTPSSGTPSPAGLSQGDVTSGDPGPFGDGPTWVTDNPVSAVSKTPKFGTMRSSVIDPFPSGRGISALGDVVGGDDNGAYITSQVGYGSHPRVFNPNARVQPPTSAGFISQSGIDPRLGARFPMADVVGGDDNGAYLSGLGRGGGGRGVNRTRSLNDQYAGPTGNTTVVVPDNMLGQVSHADVVGGDDNAAFIHRGRAGAGHRSYPYAEGAPDDSDADSGSGFRVSVPDNMRGGAGVRPFPLAGSLYQIDPHPGLGRGAGCSACGGH